MPLPKVKFSGVTNTGHVCLAYLEQYERYTSQTGKLVSVMPNNHLTELDVGYLKHIAYPNDDIFKVVSLSPGQPFRFKYKPISDDHLVNFRTTLYFSMFVRNYIECSTEDRIRLRQIHSEYATAYPHLEFNTIMLLSLCTLHIRSYDNIHSGHRFHKLNYVGIDGKPYFKYCKAIAENVPNFSHKNLSNVHRHTIQNQVHAYLNEYFEYAHSLT